LQQKKETKSGTQTKTDTLFAMGKNKICCLMFVCSFQTFVPKKNVGFGLGWDTQIPRNPNPNNTQKSQKL
jgi:hypothetical protein